MKRTGTRVGLTGGIACGKSEAGRILRRCGARVLDADRVARKLMRRNTPVYRRVVARFGREILGPGGEIDRKVLGRKVFESDRDRKALNAIVHPEVIRAWRSWAREAVRRGEDAVVVIPLLFEAGETGYWDAVICVAAPQAQVIDRLRGRGLTRKEALLRIAAQMPLKKKMRRADYVIWNRGTRAELRRAVREIWKRILKKERM